MDQSGYSTNAVQPHYTKITHTYLHAATADHLLTSCVMHLHVSISNAAAETTQQTLT